MYHLVNNYQDKSGNALPGYYVKLKIPGGAYATLYGDESGTPIISTSGVADAAVTDSNGQFDLYVDEGDYEIEFFDKNDINSRVGRVPSTPMYANTSATAALGRLAATDEGAALVAQADGRTVADIRAAADVTLYANEATGSDATGDGSSGAPYATAQKAIDSAVPFMTARKTVRVIVTGDVTTNPRTAGGASDQMERAALIYVDGLKIGKRTDANSGAGTMTGGLVLDLSGAVLKPNTTYPRGVYCTGHSGSVAIIGGSAVAQTGAESLLVAHRGCYVHVLGGTWNGNAIAGLGFVAEAGGFIESVNATVTGAIAQDVFVYEGSQVNFAASVGSSATCGSLFSQGVFKASGPVTFAGAITNAGIMIFEGTSASYPVAVNGTYTGRGAVLNCSYVEWGNYAMVARDALVRWSGVKFDCQLIKAGGLVSMSGCQSYIAGPNSPQSTPISLLYGANSFIDSTNTIRDSAGANVAPSYGTQTVTPATAPSSGADVITPQIYGGRVHDIYCANTVNATGITIANTDSAGPSGSTPGDGQRIRIWAPTAPSVIVQLVPSTTAIFDGSATFATMGNASDGQLEWIEFEYRKTVGKWKEAARKVKRSLGWTAATGTPSKGAWAAPTAAGLPVSATPTQAEVTAIRDALVAMGARLLADDQLLTNYYLKNA